ncbi:hypothetical protein JR316_0013534 [Psilocybe cubensis]|uniref:Uncharacterized protein n=1 Tax=Psilocybe cubensis TaxID=181762 RepID=A0ACB8GGF9_PSICU|nr:uncharacterized protein JR316_0013534 [Psilocybe cubensis]KAH9474184.1 hypothetical protein JR316_0013534 [Psilocybe cubensis]
MLQHFEHNIDESDIPHYPGDLTDQQVIDNLRELQDVRTGGKSQNDYLREWLPKREIYLGTLIGREAPPPRRDNQCQQCQRLPGCWRCLECFGSQLVCPHCLRQNHQLVPFHRVEKWTGEYFRPGGLWEVGIRLYLGHNGKRCPVQLPLNESTHGTSIGAEGYVGNGIQSAAENNYWSGTSLAADEYSRNGTRDAAEVTDTHDIGPTPANNDEESFTSQLLADPEIPTLFELDDGDDEDINLYEELDTSFHNQPRPRAEDNDGIPFKVIIHTSGVHYLPVRTCTCRSAMLPLDLQYLEMGLFATSFQNIRTLFTLEVLEDFRVTNLECKTSGYQYYQKLRRITSPSFPKQVLNRYRELRRLSRQYRNLILHKIHGQGHSEQALKAYMELKYPQQGSEMHPDQEPFGSITPPEPGQTRNNSSSRQSEPNEDSERNDTTSRLEVDPGDSDPNNMSPEPPSRNEPDKRGSLTLFCPACPQPGVNLPDDWVLEADSDIYIRSYVADGNFKADHLNQKNEGDDVWLSVGEGFMTDPGPYKEHIKEAISLAPRYKREPTCHNYHAQKAENRVSPGKRVRGIGAHACARHGCFCPNSVVDFDKGEKQMHMDWSLTQARETTNTKGITRHLEIYDINCQYCVNLMKRLTDSTKMHWPPSVKITFAIGLFHVHGHKSECLYNYASTYIPGVGIIDGEILEPLWSVLNDTSRSTRSATTAHRAEVLDDHMGDSNWKKTINMAATIAAKYKRAGEQSGITEAFYRNLTEQQPPELVDTWEQEIKQAEFDRDQGVSDAMSQVMASKVKTAAGRQEIELHLSNMELTSSGATGKAAWISSGLKLEQAQLELRSHVRKLGTHPSTAQQLDLVNKRRSMRTRVEAFSRTALTFLGEEALESIQGVNTPVLDDEVSDDEIADIGNVNITRADPERQPLPFPSALLDDYFRDLEEGMAHQLKGLQKLELRIRQGHAEDCLEAVRSALIQLSWQYKYQVRMADSVYTGTRAWDGVKLLNASWKLHKKIYNANRIAMIRIAGHSEEDIMQIRREFPVLYDHDCKHSAAISDPNVRGGSSDRLSWIWRSRQGLNADNQLYSFVLTGSELGHKETDGKKNYP